MWYRGFSYFNYSFFFIVFLVIVVLFCFHGWPGSTTEMQCEQAAMMNSKWMSVTASTSAVVNYCRGSGGDSQPEGVVYDNIRDLKPETKPYYQVLIDNRDFPYMVCVYVCVLNTGYKC